MKAVTEMKSVREILDELEPHCMERSCTEQPAAKERAMKDQLEELVRQMYQTGILYSEALREFKKRFTLNVLKENRGNQCKAATEMGMHRNTLSRTIAELKMQGDVDAMLRQSGGRSYTARVKLQKEYAPVHVEKTLVPRKSSTGVSREEQRPAVSTQHSA
jgi:Fis family transcriptional regulator, factor for inversion stimulation protein